MEDRAIHYRFIFRLVNRLRLVLAKVESPRLRNIMTWMLTLTVYLTLIGVGWLLRQVSLASMVPLYDGYHGMGVTRIRQDVYDRFFTSIEQCFSRAPIRTLTNTFFEAIVPENAAYWHSLCRR